MSKTKKNVLSGITLEQAHEAAQRYTEIDTRLASIEARMNEEINKVKVKYQDEITALKEQVWEPVDLLQVFAEEQKGSWGKRRSMDLLHAVIGFRTGTPKVTKNKKFTWDGVTELVKKYFPELVRTQDELNKEGIIAFSKDEAAFAKMRERCFIDVCQDETFYVEPKKEEVGAV